MMQRIETRLDSIVYHAGFAPTIFAAKQFVSHRHILVDGKIVDRASYIVKPGQVISINAEKSPKIAEIAKAVTAEAPAYFEVDKEQLKIKLVSLPTIDAIPFSVESMRVVEYYAR
jgi:small subunit ribosomal protein S4